MGSLATLTSSITLYRHHHRPTLLTELISQGNLNLNCWKNSRNGMCNRSNAILYTMSIKNDSFRMLRSKETYLHPQKHNWQQNMQVFYFWLAFNQSEWNWFELKNQIRRLSMIVYLLYWSALFVFFFFLFWWSKNKQGNMKRSILDSYILNLIDPQCNFCILFWWSRIENHSVFITFWFTQSNEWMKVSEKGRG